MSEQLLEVHMNGKTFVRNRKDIRVGSNPDLNSKALKAFAKHLSPDYQPFFVPSQSWRLYPDGKVPMGRCYDNAGDYVAKDRRMNNCRVHTQSAGQSAGP